MREMQKDIVFSTVPAEKKVQTLPEASLQDLLRRPLVHGGTNASAAHERISDHTACGKPVRILYGETVDGRNAIDSLLYYFFISAVSKTTEKQYGAKVQTTLLIADSNEGLNNSDTLEVARHALHRTNLAERVRERYGCSFDIVMQSQLKEERLEEIVEHYARSPELREAFKKATPDKKREDPEGVVRYIAMQLCSMMNYDIKIGPPRESLYDNAASILFQLMNLPQQLNAYLCPIYPLGLRFGEYAGMLHPLEHGVLPYRTEGSFGANRIIFGQTSEEEAKELIAKTELSKRTRRPNPLMPLALLGELARQHLAQKTGGSSGFTFIDYEERFKDMKSPNRILDSELKEHTFALLKRNVFEVLG